MDEHITQLSASAERLASVADALAQALARLDEQQQALNTKVERIVAAIDERASLTPDDQVRELRERISELERANTELKAQAARTEHPPATRKTLPPLVSTLLAKNGIENAASNGIDAALLDQTLASLNMEQRIAVKAEMARAGLIA